MSSCLFSSSYVEVPGDWPRPGYREKVMLDAFSMWVERDGEWRLLTTSRADPGINLDEITEKVKIRITNHGVHPSDGEVFVAAEFDPSRRGGRAADTAKSGAASRPSLNKPSRMPEKQILSAIRLCALANSGPSALEQISLGLMASASPSMNGFAVA